jgi:hypothetical protein
MTEAHSFFTTEDLKDLAHRGISKESIYLQLENFRSGFPFVELAEPCTLSQGIVRLDSQTTRDLEILGCQAAEKERILKFVPASGAATRMFKTLLACLHPSGSSDEKEKREMREESEKFFLEIKKFAFYDDLKQVLAKAGHDIDKLLKAHNHTVILQSLLTPQGLNYAQVPKGLIPFHSYDGMSRTAFEEHLIEAAGYAKDCSETIRLHFTIPSEAEAEIKVLLNAWTEKYEKKGLHFKIQVSTQKSSTDTIAVDLKNKPFRDAQGRLVFRPGGHGALIENLNELAADIVFIRNIDNIAVERLSQEICFYKRVLAGYLVLLQNIVFSLLKELNQGGISMPRLDEILENISAKLGWKIPKDLHAASAEEKRQFLFSRLNRPLRVCGMVPNRGEPGGGPFWVRDADGLLSCQIVESSQVNMDSPDQKRIWLSSTHFNPVDLVCGLRDIQGKNFNLLDFVDPHTGFISIKSKDGHELKALELPGLWNGAMARWNTAFVEVPLSTFNPVKTVMDLSKTAHQ